MNNLDIPHSASENRDMENSFALGRAVGGMEMLKVLESALSDGTRNGSPECAKALRNIGPVRQRLTQQFVLAANELGLPVSVTPKQIETLSIDNKC
ncbi:hypothetical protein [Vibrio sp. WXL103]|uniref:hypothetical protein n=1 Tax=Vibrio sp. WXL103 TaxID=3450710 RepID=UPI003EC8AF1B